MHVFINTSNKKLQILVGWGASAQVQGFGEPANTKSQLLNLIRSIRTVAKSERFYIHFNRVEKITNPLFQYLSYF